MEFYTPEECPPSQPTLKPWTEAFHHFDGRDHSTPADQNFLPNQYQPPAAAPATGNFFNPFSYTYPYPPRLEDGAAAAATGYPPLGTPQQTDTKGEEPQAAVAPPLPDPIDAQVKNKESSKKPKKKTTAFDKLNISDLINESELDADTLSAQKAERERMERVWTAQKRAAQESQQRTALLRQQQQQEYQRRMQQMQRVPEYRAQTFPMVDGNNQQLFSPTTGQPRAARPRTTRPNKRLPKAQQAWAIPNLPPSSPQKESSLPFSPGSTMESPPQQQPSATKSSPMWMMTSSSKVCSESSSSSSSSSQSLLSPPEESSPQNNQEMFVVRTKDGGASSPNASSPQPDIKKELQDPKLPEATPAPKANILLNRQLDGLIKFNKPSILKRTIKFPPTYIPRPFVPKQPANKEVILIDSSEEEEDDEAKDSKKGIKIKKDGHGEWMKPESGLPPWKLEEDSDSSLEVIDVSSGSETAVGKKVKEEVESAPEEDDDDVVMLSNDEEESEESESNEDSNEMSSSHINDYYNQMDAEGRILVNVGHPPEDPDIFLAPQITRAIKPHQVGGIRFLWDNVVENLERYRTSPGFGCILAHSMGLGKTVQVISFIDVFLTHTTSRHVICVVPINTIQNWKTEFDMWTPPAHMVHEMYIQAGEVRPRTYETFILSDNFKTLASRTEHIRTWNERGGVMLMGYEMYRMLALKQMPKSKKKKNGESDNPDTNEALNKQYFEEIYRSLVDPGPDLIICDEGHRIKNASANTSQALKNIKTKRRVVLTGYPLQNSLLEYWCMVDFIRPNYLGSKAEFCNMFERPITNGQCIDSTPRDRQLMRFRSHVLHSLLEGFVQRRGHSVLRSSLPNKDEHVLLVRMSDIQRKLYKAFVSDLLTVQNAANPLKLFAVCCKIWNHPDILYDLLQNQRQIAQGEDLDLDLATATKRGAAAARAKKDGLKNGFIPDSSMSPYRDKNDPSINYDWAMPLMKDYIPGQVSNSYKMTIMFAILEQTLAVGDKILVFSQSLFTLSLIEKILSLRDVPHRPGPPEKWARNKNYYRLDGSTNAQDREKMIQDFNGNANVVLFLLSTRAGCLGINLIGANRIIVLDASWNPCHDAQAVCRIYRYGQQKPCFIYRLITDNSLEKRIYDRQINKQGMSDRVVDELTPECNFTMKEVNTLTHENEEDNPVRDYSDIVDAFNDHILKHIYTHFNYCLSKEPFEHESLLSDRKDLKLTKQEKRMAKKSYEMEKRANMHNYRGGGTHSNFNTISNISPNLIRPWLGSAGFSLLPNQNSTGSGDKPTGGMLNNLLKPGCSVQKIKVPQDVTIPVTTPGLPPVHIKSGQEVIVMKTPKGMCLQLPGGRLVAIHFNPATLGADKQGGDKGKPTLPMKNRIVQPNLQCGGMVSMRGGNAATKRPMEVINLSDDNDSDTEAPKKLPAPPKPSISITPVSSTQPPPSKLIKKSETTSSGGDKKWPSSLSNLNLPSNLSVSILPVTSKSSSTPSTSSQPAKLIKLNSGDRAAAPSLAGLPSGIDVSILSKPQQQRPSKVTKIILPTSTAASMLAEKAAAASASSSSPSPIANIPSGVSILPFSKSSPSSVASKPNISVLPAKGKPTEHQQPSFPPNLNISLVSNSSPAISLPPSITLTPSNKDKEEQKQDETTPEQPSTLSSPAPTPITSSTIPDSESNSISEKLAEPPATSEDEILTKSAEDPKKPQSSPQPSEVAPDPILEAQRAEEGKKSPEGSGDQQANLSQQPSPTLSETPASVASLLKEGSEVEEKESSSSQNAALQEHQNSSNETEQQQSNANISAPPSSTSPIIATTAEVPTPSYQTVSQAENSLSQPSFQQDYLSNMQPNSSFFPESDSRHMPYAATSSSTNAEAPPSVQHANQPLPSSTECPTPQTSSLNLPLPPDMSHSSVGFQMPHQSMKPPPYHQQHQVTMPAVSTYAAQAQQHADQAAPQKQNLYQQQDKLPPYQKPRKPYTKKKAADRSSASHVQVPYGGSNQLFNPLSWQNAPMEENKGYTAMNPQQSNIYSQKSYDNTSWGTAYQLPPSEKPANKGGDNFSSWSTHAANPTRQGDSNQLDHFQRGPSKGDHTAQLPDLSSPSGYDWPPSSSTASLASTNQVTNTWAGSDALDKSSNDFNAWATSGVKKTSDPKTQQHQGWFEGLSSQQQQQQQAPNPTASSNSDWNSPGTSYLNLDGNTSKAGGSNTAAAVQQSSEWFHSDSAEMGFQQAASGNWQSNMAANKEGTNVVAAQGTKNAGGGNPPPTSTPQNVEASFWPESFSSNLLLQDNQHQVGTPAAAANYGSAADWNQFNWMGADSSRANSWPGYSEAGWPNWAPPYMEESRAWPVSGQQDMWPQQQQPPQGFDWSSNTQPPDLPPPT